MSPRRKAGVRRGECAVGSDPEKDCIFRRGRHRFEWSRTSGFASPRVNHQRFPWRDTFVVVIIRQKVQREVE